MFELNENVRLSSGGKLSKLSLVAQYDELMKSVCEALNEDDYLDEFLALVEHQDKCRLEWLKAVEECRRLQIELDKANHEVGDYSNKLTHARRLLDQEKKLRLKAEHDRNTLEQQMLLARDLLFNDKYHSRIPEDTREKLSFLNNTTNRLQSVTLDRNTVPVSGTRLNTISEVNSNDYNTTGSLLSDLSFSRSEDDLDVSRTRNRKWKVYQSGSDEAVPMKKTKSSKKVLEINTNDKIVATTTLSVSKDGPVTATSIIEAVPQQQNDHKPSAPPPCSEHVEKFWLRDSVPIGSPKTNIEATSVKRQHTFVSKAVIRPDTCALCNERIRFGKMVVRCKDCRGICHTECKDKMPLPCIPMVNTPTQKGVIGTIADYTPKLSPMVPALIVHCLNEIELRGLNEVGIYRVPGSEKDVKMLKQKFLRGKTAPVLNDIDVHVICGVVKDFLRSLQESLVTNALWKHFIHAVELRDKKDVAPTLYQTINQLPQPNRDTMAYIMLHLLRVSESKYCKMPANNLAKIFGPTIVGYSSQDLAQHTLLTETRQQAAVMEHLLQIPSDFWSAYVSLDSKITTPRSNVLLQTPSSVSLSQTVKRSYFTPSSNNQIGKRRKFFATPPNK